MSELLNNNQEPAAKTPFDILTLVEAPQTAIAEAQINPETQAKFDKIRSYRAEYQAKTEARITNIIDKMKADPNESHMEIYARQIADAKRILRHHQSFLEFMRIPESNEDARNRAEITHSFPKRIAEAVPDNLPLVFHGTNNIATVRKIIETGGLLTPEQKGESMTSFASGIDVTAKTNIRVSCEFAEPGQHEFMPYGAIFAFMPKAEEIEEVNRTGDGTEVWGGVDGVSFRNEPDRLYGIITTQENITRIQDWCEQYELPKERVFTHNAFIEAISQAT